MKFPEGVEKKIEALFAQEGVRLTLGGEPTYVPEDPVGPEWSVAALGPTKLRYGYALADALTRQEFPSAITVYTPGKHYPGELNPRWALQLVWRKDGVPLLKLPASAARWTTAAVKRFRDTLVRNLKVEALWLQAVDPLNPERRVWVLPLDHDGRRFSSERWKLGAKFELLRSEGPAGLRLPLNRLPEGSCGRALTLEAVDGRVELFLPPFLQRGFVRLLQMIGKSVSAGHGPIGLSGYVPSDENDTWVKLAIAADPGVLEINLPPCATASEYAAWLQRLERAGASVGLRSYKQLTPEVQGGTGGGNHLLFGGPSFDQHPFFSRPGWIASILRYWQHHPSLAYLFTGDYVGASSQAPRPDESASGLYDLEMAYRFLEKLPAGEHRYTIGETLRHLHTDTSGNTHRSEISFDKFWNQAFPGGCRGLIEFRAVETLPRADWMSAVALLWRALAAMLLVKPFRKPLIEHGDHLHDGFFLPSVLWADFEKILSDLKRAGIALPVAVYRAIFEWRFPVLLTHRNGRGEFTVRRAHESWPLLSETPLEGGSTSRFVDTSIERLEFTANEAFVRESKVFVQDRLVQFQAFPHGFSGLGLRYRRSALYPSLHPGIPPQLPLRVAIDQEGDRTTYILTADQRFFQEDRAAPAPKRRPPVRKLAPELVTYDLRLP
jgi:uncharacterized protein (DUF2126 family)